MLHKTFDSLKDGLNEQLNTLRKTMLKRELTPEEEAVLWVCTRELATNVVLSRPGIRTRLDELLLALATSQAAAQQDLVGRLGQLAGGDDVEGSGLGPGMDLASLGRIVRR